MVTPPPENFQSTLEESGKVDAAVIAEFEESSSQSVLITYIAKPSPQERISAGESIRADLASSTLQLDHQFQLITAFSATISIQDALDLASHSKVDGIRYNPQAEPLLQEATAVVQSDIVNDPPYSLGGNGTTVAVIDNGIDTDHPNLQDQIHPVQRCMCVTNCCQAPDIAEDDLGHGTKVSGIIASPDGVAPDSSILAIKTVDSTGNGLATHVKEAMEEIALNPQWGVDMINISLAFDTANGGNFFDGECSDIPFWNQSAKLVSILRSQGVLVVAGSGNRGEPDREGAPACLSNVISAGATWDDDGLVVPPETYAPCPDGEITNVDDMACFTSHNQNTSVLAPGGFMETTEMGGGYTAGDHTDHGTSFSTPMVAGCGALLRQDDAGYTAQEIEEALTQASWVRVPSHTPSENDKLYTRLDCLAAVEWARHNRSDVEAFSELDSGGEVLMGFNINGERASNDIELTWRTGSISEFWGGAITVPLHSNCEYSEGDIGAHSSGTCSFDSVPLGESIIIFGFDTTGMSAPLPTTVIFEVEVTGSTPTDHVASNNEAFESVQISGSSQ